jgi:WD40 repeat protein
MGNVGFWDPDHPDHRPIEHKGHSSEIIRAVISSSSREVFTFDRDGALHSWSVDGSGPGSHEQNFKLPHGGWTTVVAIGPDGTPYVVDTSDGRVTTRSPKLEQEGGEIVRTFPGGGPVRVLAIGADGSRAFSVTKSSGDGSPNEAGLPQIWNPLWAEDPPVALPASVAEITAAAFTTDGRLVTGARDGRIELWESDLEKLVLLAGKVAGRDLTLAEWQESFQGQTYRPTFPHLRFYRGRP